MKKERVDKLLIDRGLVADKTEAAKLIMAGLIRLNENHVIRNASEKFSENTPLIVNSPDPYVSRGAKKLMPALDEFFPDLTGATAIDLGASTGGFTDLMLQRGAIKVFAVDSGHGHLHYKLRQNPAVINLEKTNARYLSSDHISSEVDIITSDVSFISVTKVLEPASNFLKENGWAFILIKPQFEVAKKDVGDGIIRDEELRLAMIDKVSRFCTEVLSWQLLKVIPSPIKGPKGNQEYVAVFRK